MDTKDKQEMMKKAYLNAVDNMVISGLDNEVCYIVIRESMKLYLKGHKVEATEGEIVSYIKSQVEILHKALSDYEVGAKFEHIGHEKM
ncbi:hypothetical protein [Hornefia butyriciproducens]|jgi:hypothetical protein|uniref:Uncharacterized protein n=1 Tax=Hornefia butyriciproducens TaxID=2652293 RepID=A0A6L5Y4K7_9FIRM|nr:hypothetical protein [Hornefia butyriciproducens]MCI7413025.1 hypothetical protein [Clostridiales bacterium]MCI7679368.1 hypothetical protein [Clostridiales bacterium]MDD7019733.1 hypothetical protein [Hornefia butyriciproducens]MDY5423107.1 hypothetical protein [Hornefia butyriciproducens]MDY5463519.1 hypothetical protein [Hornefia butyriciproducens]